MNRFLTSTTHSKPFKMLVAVVVMAGVIAFPSDSTNAEAGVVAPQCEIDPKTLISCSAEVAKGEIANIILPVPVVGAETDNTGAPKFLELALVNTTKPVYGPDPNEHWTSCHGWAEARNGMNDPVFDVDLYVDFKWNSENVLAAYDQAYHHEWNGWQSREWWWGHSPNPPAPEVEAYAESRVYHHWHGHYGLTVWIVEESNGLCRVDWELYGKWY